MYKIGDTVKIKKGVGDLKDTVFIYSTHETGLNVSINLKQPIDWSEYNRSRWSPVFKSKYCYTVRTLLIERKYVRNRRYCKN